MMQKLQRLYWGLLVAGILGSPCLLANTQQVISKKISIEEARAKLKDLRLRATKDRRRLENLRGKIAPSNYKAAFEQLRIAEEKANLLAADIDQMEEQIRAEQEIRQKSGDAFYEEQSRFYDRILYEDLDLNL